MTWWHSPLSEYVLWWFPGGLPGNYVTANRFSKANCQLGLDLNRYLWMKSLVSIHSPSLFEIRKPQQLDILCDIFCTEYFLEINQNHTQTPVCNEIHFNISTCSGIAPWYALRFSVVWIVCTEYGFTFSIGVSQWLSGQLSNAWQSRAIDNYCDFHVDIHNVNHIPRFVNLDKPCQLPN